MLLAGDPGGRSRKEANYREGLRFNPASDELLLGLADLMNNAGRNVEAADLAVLAVAHASQIDPAQLYGCRSRSSGVRTALPKPTPSRRRAPSFFRASVPSGSPGFIS